MLDPHGNTTALTTIDFDLNRTRRDETMSIPVGNWSMEDTIEGEILPRKRRKGTNSYTQEINLRSLQTVGSSSTGTDRAVEKEF
jgi:hypothetical protein